MGRKVAHARSSDGSLSEKAFNRMNPLDLEELALTTWPTRWHIPLGKGLVLDAARDDEKLTWLKHNLVMSIYCLVHAVIRCAVHARNPGDLQRRAQALPRP